MVVIKFVWTSSHCSRACIAVSGEEYVNPWASMCSENMDKGLNEMAGGLKDFHRGNTELHCS